MSGLNRKNLYEICYFLKPDESSSCHSGKEEGNNYLYQRTYQKSCYVALKYVKQEEIADKVIFYDFAGYTTP